jgi:hypothetical protein
MRIRSIEGQFGSLRASFWIIFYSIDKYQPLSLITRFQAYIVPRLHMKTCQVSIELKTIHIIFRFVHIQ